MCYFLTIRSYQYKNMCLVKAKQEYRTILDFSWQKRVSKNLVRQSLRKAEISDFRRDSGSIYILDNEIKVGMYRIKLLFSSLDSSRPRQRLREYKGVGIAILEGSDPYSYESISIDKDKRFCYKNWLLPSVNYSLRLNDLVDVIVHCSKLNKLKVFN